MSLDGRVALVTGGGRGIGRGISVVLAAAGATVAVNYRKDEEAANETVATVEAGGGKAKAYQGSVTEPDDNERMVAQVVADFGKLDIVVQNGGIASRGLPVVKTEASELERVVRTHALGPHHLASVAVPAMRENDRSDMVFISSVATLGHGANGAPYNMGKAAMESLAYTLAKAIVGVEDIHELDRTMPFGHVCTPEDIAGVVKFLVSSDSGYVTGEKINVHGGGQDWRDHDD